MIPSRQQRGVAPASAVAPHWLSTASAAPPSVRRAKRAAAPELAVPWPASAVVTSRATLPILSVATLPHVARTNAGSACGSQQHSVPSGAIVETQPAFAAPNAAAPRGGAAPLRCAGQTSGCARRHRPRATNSLVRSTPPAVAVSFASPAAPRPVTRSAAAAAAAQGVGVDATKPPAPFASLALGVAL